MQHDALDREREGPVIDHTGLAFSTGDRHHLPVAQEVRAVFGAYHGGYAKFATDNGGMAGASPPVGNDSRRLLHDRLPVRVGLVRDQHLPRLEGLQMMHIFDQTHRTMTNFFSNTLTAYQHRPALLQVIAL